MATWVRRDDAGGLHPRPHAVQMKIAAELREEEAADKEVVALKRMPTRHARVLRAPGRAYPGKS